MAMSISNMSDKTLWFSKLLKNNLYNLDIGLFAMSTEVVDLSDLALLQNCKNSIAVILNIEPVTNIQTLAIYRKCFVMSSIMNHERNQLLRKLVRTIVVGATANGNR